MPTPAFLTVPSLSLPISLPSLVMRIFSTVSGSSKPAAIAVPPRAATSAVRATANAGLRQSESWKHVGSFLVVFRQETPGGGRPIDGISRSHPLPP